MVKNDEEVKWNRCNERVIDIVKQVADDERYKRATEYCENHECEECIIFQKKLYYVTETERKFGYVPCCINLVRHMKKCKVESVDEIK